MTPRLIQTDKDTEIARLRAEFTTVYEFLKSLEGDGYGGMSVYKVAVEIARRNSA